MTPQYRWQLKQKEAGKCVICGKKLYSKWHCRKHAMDAAKRAREYYYTKQSLREKEKG